MVDNADNAPYARPEEFGRPKLPSDLSIDQRVKLAGIAVFIYVYVNHIAKHSESGYAHGVIDLPINYMDRHIVADFRDLVCGIECCLILSTTCISVNLVAFQNDTTR